MLSEVQNAPDREIGVNRSRRRSMLAKLRQMRRDRNAMAAVEFALVAPILMALYFGITEIGDAVVVYTKVTHTASAINDLVSQAKSITNADMASIFSAASSIMVPKSTSNLTIVVTAIQTDAASKATVAWADGLHKTPPAKNSSYTLPANLVAPNAFYVDAKVVYTYQPLIGFWFPTAVPLSRESYLLPRNTSAITRIP
ncbi:MAG: TadE/TadG family type IV pilus assembly protein [Bauldia sp.]